MGPWTERQKQAFERLLKRQKNECYFCENKSIYTQPHPDSGRIIDVCDTHFTMKFGG
jgi:hypothetical protein